MTPVASHCDLVREATFTSTSTSTTAAVVAASAEVTNSHTGHLIVANVPVEDANIIVTTAHSPAPSTITSVLVHGQAAMAHNTHGTHTVIPPTSQEMNVATDTVLTTSVMSMFIEDGAQPPLGTRELHGYFILGRCLCPCRP